MKRLRRLPALLSARTAPALAAAALASVLTVTGAMAGQQEQCDADARAIVLAAYPHAVSLADDRFDVDDGTVVLPAEGQIGAHPHAVVCRRWPANPHLVLVAVPVLHEVGEDGSEGDLDLLVVDRASLEIAARLRLAGFMMEDAIRIGRIYFDTARYRLFAGRTAFGLRVSVEGSSRPNPFHQTTLRLYDLDGGELKTVLDNLVVRAGGGEWDTRCAGEFHRTSRTLALDDKAHEGGADILVTTRSERIVAEEIEGRCEDTVTETRSMHRLVFDGDAYAVPDALRSGLRDRDG